MFLVRFKKFTIPLTRDGKFFDNEKGRPTVRSDSLGHVHSMAFGRSKRPSRVGK